MVTTLGDIIPDYLRRRIRVAAAFTPYLTRADAARDSPLMATLEALRADVLDALDDDYAPRETSRNPGKQP